MTNSILMYLVQNENEIPAQLIPNTAYYIIGKEVRIIDNLGHPMIFVMNNNNNNENDFLSRIEICEKKVEVCDKKLQKIYSYLTSFNGDDKNE